MTRRNARGDVRRDALEQHAARQQVQRHALVAEQPRRVEHLRPQQRLAAGEHDDARAERRQRAGERADLVERQIAGAALLPPVARHAAAVAAARSERRSRSGRTNVRFVTSPSRDQRRRCGTTGRGHLISFSARAASVGTAAACGVSSGMQRHRRRRRRQAGQPAAAAPQQRRLQRSGTPHARWPRSSRRPQVHGRAGRTRQQAFDFRARNSRVHERVQRAVELRARRSRGTSSRGRSESTQFCFAPSCALHPLVERRARQRIRHRDADVVRARSRAPSRSVSSMSSQRLARDSRTAGRSRPRCRRRAAAASRSAI